MPRAELVAGRDALVTAGFACIVSETLMRPFATWTRCARAWSSCRSASWAWTPVLSHIAERKAGLPVLGVVDKEANVDVSPALKLGVQGTC